MPLLLRLLRRPLLPFPLLLLLLLLLRLLRLRLLLLLLLHQNMAGGFSKSVGVRVRRSAPLLHVMSQLLASTEVFVSGVYRLRPKLPGRDNGVVPWHQDQCL